MKLWLPTRDRWRKPPVGLARIDWSHPLARGLRRSWLINEGAGLAVVDLVTQGASIFNAAPTWSPSKFGSSANVAASQYATTGFVGFGAMMARGTFGGLVRFTNTSARYTLFGAVSTGTSTLTELTYNYGGTADRLGFNIRDTAGTYWRPIFNSSGFSDGLWHSFVLAWDVVTDYARLCVDGGIPVAESSFEAADDATNLANFTHAPTLCGRNVRGSIDQLMNGGCATLNIWDYPLSLSQMVEWCVNPYAFLQPVRTRTYFVPAGGAPQSETFEASGGAIAGGSASSVQEWSARTGSGGGVAGGEATVSEWSTYEMTMSGGALAGGSATVVQEWATRTGSSGGVCGGSSPTVQEWSARVPTDGALAGGAATVLQEWSTRTGSRGAVAGGSCTFLQEWAARAASGGGIAGGAADVSGLAQVEHFDASGGALAGGTAAVLQEWSGRTGSGGGVCGGAATVTRPSAAVEAPRKAVPMSVLRDTRPLRKKDRDRLRNMRRL